MAISFGSCSCFPRRMRRGWKMMGQAWALRPPDDHPPRCVMQLWLIGWPHWTILHPHGLSYN